MQEKSQVEDIYQATIHLREYMKNIRCGYQKKEEPLYTYENIFEFRSLGIKIKKTNKDTCATCDKFAMVIKNSSEQDKQRLRDELKVHQTEAEAAYEAKRRDKEKSATDPCTLVYTFDLQQCLPTPDIKTSVAFYKRQLLTFNFTMRRCDDKQCFCYIWHQVIAGRGANQIAS
uniref:Uncharacterized protein LOC114348922 n=1 Tax=Diabrotica virgifera virgifera TaxID=50390 RepID=A0A6P7HC18_DIAVI